MTDQAPDPVEAVALDNCQLCLGAKGGVRGNENRFGELVVCDYCTIQILPVLNTRTTPHTEAGSELIEALRDRFLPAILHGDGAHQAWLKEAVECFITGRPVPPPTGSGSAAPIEALRHDLERAMAAGNEHLNDLARVRNVGRKASAWLRECSTWLLTTDLDMQCPMETDPLDIADELDGVSADVESQPMSTNRQDAAVVAASLTPTMRAFVGGPLYTFWPYGIGAAWSCDTSYWAAYQLVKLGLATRHIVEPGHVASVPTPLGLAVRRELERNKP